MSSLLVGPLSARSSWCRPPGHKSRTVPQRRQCGLFRLFNPGIERGRAMAAWTLLFEPGPALILLIALLVPQAVAAPVSEHDTTDMEYYPVADSTGCYYNFQHYDEGDRIITNEPCLNCTCHNRMLMCYLRVCPFTKAIGQDCKVEKRPDQCCPVITCPEVPVQLLTSTTQSSTEVGHPDAYGCSIDGLFYSDGARVPSDSNKPCELCYCIRNKTACVMQECTLKVEGCKPVYQEGVCCPVRYNCEHPDYNLLETTTRKLITTTALPTTTLPGPVDCVYNNEVFADGALIIKDKPCERCYCMRGDIVCAVQECNPTPLDKVNCTALPPKEGQCCPENYDCDYMIEEEITTGGYLYTTPSITLEETTQAKAEHPLPEENEITQQGELTTLPPAKEGEILHEPVTVLPDEGQKAHPEILEQEDHEEPLKGGVTPMLDERTGITEQTTQPAPQGQVTEYPGQEDNEIPEKHEIVTAGPEEHGQIPEQDETAYPAHPFKEHEPQHPEQVTEAGSGAGEAPSAEETQKPEEIPQATTDGKVEESVTTAIPQKSEEEEGTETSPASEQPEEGKPTEQPHVISQQPEGSEVTEQPHLTEGPLAEGKPTELPSHVAQPETEQPEAELPEQPQYVPPEEGEEQEEFPEQHATEPEAEGKGTEAPQKQVPEESTTEHPHIIEHVTEMAPAIGTGLPQEAPAEGETGQIPEEGKSTETSPEQTTVSVSEEGKPTEAPQLPVTEKTLEQATKQPSGHVPKKEVEEGESTEMMPQGEITESPPGAGPQEASTSRHVSEETTAIPPEHVTQGQISESESTEHVTHKPVTETDGTELPQEQITEGTPAEGGKGTELPKPGEEKSSELPTEIPEIATEKQLVTQSPAGVTESKPTELPQAQMTEKPSEEAEATEIPAQQPIVPESGKGSETEIPGAGKATELPPEIEEGKTTEIPKEDVESPSTQVITSSVEEETEAPQGGKATELPPEHGTQPSLPEYGTEPAAEEDKKTEGESTELPPEGTAQPGIEEGKKTEKPQEGKVTELPPEVHTQPTVAKETEKPEEGEKITLAPEHVTQPTAEEGKETSKPSEEGKEVEKPQEGTSTETPLGYVTQPEETEKTELTHEHVTQSATEEGKGTEPPESQVIEEGKTTEVAQEQVTVKPEKPEHATESKAEQSTPQYAEEPNLIENEVPAYHPIEEGENEVSEHETERPIPHPVETPETTATPGVTEGVHIETSAPSVEGETEKTQESTTKLGQPEGHSEESVTESGMQTTKTVMGETEAPIATEQGSVEKGEATTTKYLPEGQITELPHVTISEEEKATKPAEEHVTEAEEPKGTATPQQTVTEGEIKEAHTEISVTEGEIQEAQTEKSVTEPMVEEKVTELPKHETEPAESQTKQKPSESSTIPGEMATSAPIGGESSEGTTESPRVHDLEHPQEEEEEHGIPGEGSCLVDGQTYKNNSNVPPINHCQISCKCVSSILQCESVTCTPPPSNLQHCMPVYQGPDSCCPTYSCTVPGVTSMESDSHKMDTTTNEIPTEEPGIIGVTVGILSEQGTLRPESTTALGREETEAPAYISPIDRVPSLEKIPQEVPPEYVTEEVPHPQDSETETPSVKVPEPIPGQPEEPYAVTTESEVGKPTMPVIQEGITNLPPEQEIGQTTEKHLETKPSTEMGVTEISQKGTMPPEIVEPGTEHLAEVSPTTEYPSGVVHDEVHPEADEGENEIEDHTVYEHPAVSQETEELPEATEKVPEIEAEGATTVPTARVPAEPESTEKPESATEIPTQPPSIGVIEDRIKETTTEESKKQPSEHVTEPTGESVATEKEGEVQVTEEGEKQSSEHVTEPIGESVTTEKEGEVRVTEEGEKQSPEHVTEPIGESVTTEKEGEVRVTEEGEKQSPEHVTEPVGESVTTEKEGEVQVTEEGKEQSPEHVTEPVGESVTTEKEGEVQVTEEGGKQSPEHATEPTSESITTEKEGTVRVTEQAVEGEKQPTEHITEPIGESVTTETEGIVRVTEEIATEGVQEIGKEPAIPEMTTSVVGIKSDITEAPQGEITELPTEISASENVDKLTTERSKPETPEMTTVSLEEHIPEHVTETKGVGGESVTEPKVVSESATEIAEETATEGVKPTSPESITERFKEVEEAITEGKKEEPEMTTLPQIPSNEVPQFDETGAYPHEEEEEQEPGQQITEGPQGITTPEKAIESEKTPSEQVTEGEILEGVTEASSTAKMPESISHVTELPTQGEAEVTEKAHKEEQAPSEVEGTPATIPEVVTVLPEQPSVSEAGAAATERITEQETEPSAQTTTPSYIRKPVEGAAEIPEKEEPVHTTIGYKPEGTTLAESAPEQPTATEKEGEAVAQTISAFVPESASTESVPSQGSDKEGEEKVYPTPGYEPESSTSSDTETKEQEKEGEPSATTPSYVPEASTVSESVPEGQEKEGQPFATSPPYIPESSTTAGHIPEDTEKEGEPSIPTTVTPEKLPEHVPTSSEKEGEPSVETTPRYAPEGITELEGVTGGYAAGSTAAPEGQVPTETEPAVTEGVAPEVSGAPALPSVTEKPEEITEKILEGTISPQEQQPVTEAAETPQEAQGQVTEGAVPPQVTETALPPKEQEEQGQVTESSLPPKEQEQGQMTQEPVSGVTTEKSLEVPTTVLPSGTEKVPEEGRPGIPGEGETPEPVKPEESVTVGQEGKPEEAFTSPPLAETTQLPQINASTERGSELYTSGPFEEPSTKKNIPGELSTSAPTTVLTSSTTLPPSHDIPEEDYHQEPVEEDYEEEQSAFGPGTCRYGGKVYVSAQQIPRDDPCDFCFCFRSDIICLQQSCPPPIPHCHEEPIRGFCCPRYECPVSMATAVNVTTTSTTTTTTLPPHFLSHAYKGRAHRTGCQINNKAYHVGEEIKSASGPCLHCKCGGNGQMKCDPKACSPEPMLRQMIAAAESRRRR